MSSVLSPVTATAKLKMNVKIDGDISMPQVNYSALQDTVFCGRLKYFILRVGGRRVEIDVHVCVHVCVHEANMKHAC